MELEAAAALFSILRSESKRGVAKAAAVAGTAKKAPNKSAEAEAADAETKGGTDKDAGAGDTDAVIAPLPLSVLVSAIKSLRKLVGNAMVFENSKATMKWGRQGGFGNCSMVRLVRYLARQCDK